MASNKKQQPPAVSEILREQIQLVKSEREIKALLEKVNGQINELLVEESQLHSSLITQNQKSMPIVTAKIESINASDRFDSTSVINEQTLNLYAAKSSQSIEEYDD